MKTIFLTAALASLGILPAHAHPHHEVAYGVFWKPGLKSASLSLGEIWRYAFVSTYTWAGCGMQIGTDILESIPPKPQ